VFKIGTLACAIQDLYWNCFFGFTSIPTCDFQSYTIAFGLCYGIFKKVCLLSKN